MAGRSLTQLQRRHVRQVVRDGHLAFLAEVFGPTAIDRDDYDRLLAAGKIRDDRLLPRDAASAAHAVGSIAGLGDAGELAPLLSDPSRFWGHVGDDPGVVTEAEREAVAVMRDRVGQHVRALGARLEDAVLHAVADADDSARRRRVTGKPGPEPADSYAEEVLARVRVAANDLRRDWLRVAHTEVHNAAEEAKAIAFASGHPDRDPRVFKRPHQDSCAFCRLLYLRPDGVTPRVFRLSALLANGTNVGRRAGRPAHSGRSRTEWRAVVGAAHPFCRCELSVLAEGMGFDAHGQLVYVGAAKSMPVEAEHPDEQLSNHVCEED